MFQISEYLVAFAHVPKIKRSKSMEKTNEYIMIGYNIGGYRLFDSNSKRIITSRDVTFDESPIEEADCETEVNEPEVQTEEETESPKEIETEIETEDENQYGRGLRKKTPKNFGPDFVTYHCAYNAVNWIEDTPLSYSEIEGNQNEAEWRKAVNDEIKSLMDNETWKVVPVPSKVKLIGTRWIFKLKSNEDGNPCTFKARLVAKGYQQKAGIDYVDTYAPVARLQTIRLILSLCVKNDFVIYHLDVRTAFLHGFLNEDVYLRIPEGIEVPDGHVLKLNKSLYGRKARNVGMIVFINLL